MKKYYRRTKEEKWSTTIQKRRQRWLGHLLRLPENSPARLALSEALRTVKKPKGKQKTTWIKMVNKLQKHNLHLGQLEDLANNRDLWDTLWNRT